MKPADLVTGVALLGLVSTALFWGGLTVTRRTRPLVTALVGVAVLILLLTYGFWLYGTLTIARILPFSNVIVVGNWIPPGAAVLMGILAGQRSIPRWRRYTLLLLLACLAWYPVARDLLPSRPAAGRPRFLRGVCMQTTPASCSACSAVSLLLEHGIPATEREMMDLCLTRWNGTPELGLYRGLKLKTANTDWDVQVLETDLDTLRRTNACPAILLVRTSREASAEPSRMVDHTIVVYEFSDHGFLEVADPGSGRERWQVSVLREKVCGTALRLAPRRPKELEAEITPPIGRRPARAPPPGIEVVVPGQRQIGAKQPLRRSRTPELGKQGGDLTVELLHQRCCQRVQRISKFDQLSLSKFSTVATLPSS